MKNKFYLILFKTSIQMINSSKVLLNLIALVCLYNNLYHSQLYAILYLAHGIISARSRKATFLTNTNCEVLRNLIY